MQMEGKTLYVRENCIHSDSKSVGILIVDCQCLKLFSREYLMFKSHGDYDILMQLPELASRMIAPAQLCNMILAVLGLRELRLPGL